MDIEADTDLPAPPAAVFAQVRELSGYPAWLGIVHRAVVAPAAPGDPGPAWLMDLGARIGPISRAKRVRMVRVIDDPPAQVRFERQEVDGRNHSAWILSGRIEGAVDPGGSRLHLHLHYGGRGWLPLVELALHEEIRRAGPRLARVLGESDGR